MGRRIRNKRGPKPGFMPAVNVRKKAERDAEYIAAVRKDPIGASKTLRTMDHAELRLLAKGLHLPQHNIDELTEDKLRQNCLMQVGQVYEALAGD